MVSSIPHPAAVSELDLLTRPPDRTARRLPGARALPIGTERYRASEGTKGLVRVKVGSRGKRSQQWRPKHQVVWERANGRKVPAGFRVIFRDGDKRNFDPANLALRTPGEIFARAMVRFLANPPALRRVIRLNRKLERELRRQISGCRLATDGEIARDQGIRMPATGSRK
jgi:HNH endonuclease